MVARNKRYASADQVNQAEEPSEQQISRLPVPITLTTTSIAPTTTVVSTSVPVSTALGSLTISGSLCSSMPGYTNVPIDVQACRFVKLIDRSLAGFYSCLMGFLCKHLKIKVGSKKCSRKIRNNMTIKKTF